MGKAFLLMARVEEQKIIAASENKEQWISFHNADFFGPGEPFYVNDAVFAKISENAYKNRLTNPGFAIVDESQMRDVKDARNVVVLGDIEALNKIAHTKAKDAPAKPDAEEPAPKEKPAENVMPISPAAEERYPCPIPSCKRVFNDPESLEDHMEYHKQQKAKYKPNRDKRGPTDG